MGQMDGGIFPGGDRHTILPWEILEKLEPYLTAKS
jgi:hypothetical protein